MVVSVDGNLHEPFILVIPYCEEYRNASKILLRNLGHFKNCRYKITIKWLTRKVKSLFKVKTKNPHPYCVIYRCKCSCGEEYIGETERNVEKCRSEHNNPTEKTEPARHLSSNISHLFAWEILMPAPKNKRTRKKLGTFFITFLKPSLNEQVKLNVLHLF